MQNTYPSAFTGPRGLTHAQRLDETLRGYTHLLVYSRQLARPVAAIVGDIFHDLRLYTAVHEPDGRGRAYVTLRDGQRRDLTSRPRPADTDEQNVPLCTTTNTRNPEPKGKQVGTPPSVAGPMLRHTSGRN
jgi:hypothetical protein